MGGPGPWRELLLVGLGGFLGSAARYLGSGLVQKWTSSAFPAGTLFVNAVGCLLIGLLGGYAETHKTFGEGARLFLFVGVLGGFTTFSTFGYETLNLLREGDALRAGLNVTAQVLLGLASAWLGYTLMR